MLLLKDIQTNTVHDSLEINHLIINPQPIYNKTLS